MVVIGSIFFWNFYIIFQATSRTRRQLMVCANNFQTLQQSETLFTIRVNRKYLKKISEQIFNVPASSLAQRENMNSPHPHPSTQYLSFLHCYKSMNVVCVYNIALFFMILNNDNTFKLIFWLQFLVSETGHNHRCINMNKFVIKLSLINTQIFYIL